MKRIFVQFITNDIFKIVYQTDIYNNFIGCDPGDEYDERDKFVYNGFWLASRHVPEVCSNGLFVMGGKVECENPSLRSPNNTWKRKLFEAINAYNRKFA